MASSFSSVVFIALALMAVCDAQMGMPGMGSPKKQKPPANKEDVKLIKCEVCQEMIKSVHREAKKMREELPKNKKRVDEMDLIKKLEKVCDPETAAGDWINKFDLLEEGRYLKVVEQESFGKCGTECRTIARACEQVVGDYDTDIAEALWKGDKKRAALTNMVCHELSEACTSKAPKMPKGRKPGPAFQPLSDKEREMATMMHNMQGVEGMPGMQMFQRDELLEQMQENYGDYLEGGEGGYDDDYGGAGESTAESEGTATSGGEDGEESLLQRGMSYVSDLVKGGASKEDDDAGEL